MSFTIQMLHIIIERSLYGEHAHKEFERAVCQFDHADDNVVSDHR